MVLLYRAGEGSIRYLLRGQHTPLIIVIAKLTPKINLASPTLCFVLSSTSMFDKHLSSVISWPREVPLKQPSRLLSPRPTAEKARKEIFSNITHREFVKLKYEIRERVIL